MSRDLRQFFTSDSEIQEFTFAHESPEEFIATVLGYQEDATEVVDYIEENIEMLADITNDDISDFESLNVHLFYDLLGGSIYDYIFSSFLKKKDFELKDLDTTLDYLYDGTNEKFIDITNEFPDKLNGYINNFYKDVKRECFYENEYDSYTASTINLRIYHLKLKNKSMARKLRKMYIQKKELFRMMTEIEFEMVNGEFIYIEAVYIENDGFYNRSILFAPVTDAIIFLNKKLKTGRIHDDGIYYILDEVYNLTDNSDFINLILRTLSTDEEVIIWMKW